jgi:hypothetical protein
MSSVTLEQATFVPPVNPKGWFLPLADNEPIKPTYILAGYNVAPGTSATDLINIQNPAGSGKVFRVKSVLISGTCQPNAQVQAAMYRRAALSSGGTSTVQTVGVMDTSDPVSVAVVRLWTAAPTTVPAAVGAPLGMTRLQLTGGVVDRSTSWQKSWLNDEAIVIRPGEVLAVNLAGRTYTAGNDFIDYEIVWTEENV